MRLLDVVTASTAVAGASRRLDKIAVLATLIARTPPADVATVVSYLSGVLPQGRTGIGGAALRAAADVVPAAEPTLTVTEVDELFSQLAVTGGAGANAARLSQLRQLLSRATRDEQGFLVRLLIGELRQGALESLLVDAVARAFELPVARVRRAVMMAGALAPVARAIAADGSAALETFALTLMRPVQPMLADSAADVGAALAAGQPATIEWKLDGARIQVHKADDEVRIFSRALNDVTAAIPEVVDAVRQLPARSLILDGEAIALRPDGSPHPFQVTMRRFGRRLDVEAQRRELPITPLFFDCLYLDGAPLVDDPLSRRVAVLDGLLGSHATERLDDGATASLSVPRRTVTNVVEAEAFAAAALAGGHEGVMVKALDAPYAAGRRGSAWIKVKPARTLDLVVLAAEWGSGRRRGWLSNLHLGARDEERGGFVMLGKTFKGLTDEMLAWQTARLLSLEVGRDDYTVFVSPALVVEIAFNDIQESPQYPGRLALRFARVKRYREDKTAVAADTFATLQQIYQQTTGLPAPPR